MNCSTTGHWQLFRRFWETAKKADAEYLDDCRKKRNIVEYDYVGGASESDADELIVFVKDLRDEVITWLKKNHPELL